MRRKLLFAVAVALTVLATAGVAAAANGGFTPQFAHSPNAHRTNTAYYVVLIFTSVIFLDRRGRARRLHLEVPAARPPAHGRRRQVHGHTRLEVIWTVIPVIILAVIGIVIFYELPAIANAPAAANPIRITVEGHQFYWQFDYPNGSRSINDLHVPVDQVVLLTVKSYDVVHSWWIPQLGGKIQAIPGRTNHIWFKADRAGTYYGQCAELCGLYHEAMHARVLATSDERTTHVRHRAPPRRPTSAAPSSRASARRATGCRARAATARTSSNNSLLTQPSGLAAIVRDGRGNMPPVGDSWTKAQMSALLAYAKSHVYKGASTSGG